MNVNEDAGVARVAIAIETHLASLARSFFPIKLGVLRTSLSGG
jgi:hypothetical protein